MKGAFTIHKCNIIRINRYIMFVEACVMVVILDIYEVMHQLSMWRPIFHFEADFQFSLAYKKEIP